jgi:hypothetical protein
VNLDRFFSFLIYTQSVGARAGKDGSCFRPCGHCDRLRVGHPVINFVCQSPRMRINIRPKGPLDRQYEGKSGCSDWQLRVSDAGSCSFEDVLLVEDVVNWLRIPDTVSCLLHEVWGGIVCSHFSSPKLLTYFVKIWQGLHILKITRKFEFGACRSKVVPASQALQAQFYRFS